MGDDVLRYSQYHWLGAILPSTASNLRSHLLQSGEDCAENAVGILTALTWRRHPLTLTSLTNRPKRHNSRYLKVLSMFTADDPPDGQPVGLSLEGEE